MLIPAASKRVSRPYSSLMLMPLASKLVAPSIVVVPVTSSRLMPAVFCSSAFTTSPTSLSSRLPNVKLSAVIAPPSIMVWLSAAAPTVITPLSTMVSPIVIAVSLNSAPFSIVVVPLPGAPASAGSRSIPPTLSGRAATFNSSAYASKSLIASPTSLLSKLPKFRLPLTTVLPVAASTVKLPEPIFKLPSISALPLTVKSLLSLVCPLTVKPPPRVDRSVTFKVPPTVALPVTPNPPPTVALPVTPNPPPTVALPVILALSVTVNKPPIVVLPPILALPVVRILPSPSTPNLLLAADNSPLTVKLPSSSASLTTFKLSTVAAPVTFKVSVSVPPVTAKPPLRVALPVTSKVPPTSALPLDFRLSTVVAPAFKVPFTVVLPAVKPASVVSPVTFKPP